MVINFSSIGKQAIKRYRIFLASSITEFEVERHKILAYANKISSQTIDKGIFIEVDYCDDESEIIEQFDKQEMYNEMIKNSNCVALLVGEKIGNYTREEIAVAQDSLQNEAVNLEKMHVFFFKDKASAQDVESFKEKYADSSEIQMYEQSSLEDVYKLIDQVAKQELEKTKSQEQNPLTAPADIKRVKFVYALDKNTTSKNEEFEKGKAELEAFLMSENKQFIDNGLFFESIDFQEYKDAPFEKDTHYYVIVDDTISEEIRAGFDDAFLSFKEYDTPQIRTFFLELDDGRQKDDQLIEFKDHLKNDLAHFRTCFKCFAQIKLNLLEEVIVKSAKESGFNSEIVIRDGKLYVGDDELPIKIDLSQVPFYANNKALSGIEAQLQEIKNQRSKAESQRTEDTENEYNVLMQALEKKEESLKNERNQIEIKIMQTYRLLLGQRNEEINETIAQATELFEQGDTAKALEVLNPERIKSAISRNFARLSEQITNLDEIIIEFELCIAELKLRISFLKTSRLNSKNISAIVDSYEEACGSIAEMPKFSTGHVVIKSSIIDVFADYAEFLASLDEYEKAITQLDKALELQADIYAELVLRIYRLKADAYHHLLKSNNEKDCRLKAIEILEGVIDNDPSAYLDIYSQTLFSLGNLLHEQGDDKSAQEYIEKSADVYDEYFQQNKEQYLKPYFTALMNTGNYFRDCSKQDYSVMHISLAKKHYKKAFDVYLLLVEEDSVSYGTELHYAAAKFYEENYEHWREISKESANNQTVKKSYGTDCKKTMTEIVSYAVVLHTIIQVQLFKLSPDEISLIRFSSAIQDFSYLWQKATATNEIIDCRLRIVATFEQVLCEESLNQILRSKTLKELADYYCLFGESKAAEKCYLENIKLFNNGNSKESIMQHIDALRDLAYFYRCNQNEEKDNQILAEKCLNECISLIENARKDDFSPYADKLWSVLTDLGNLYECDKHEPPVSFLEKRVCLCEEYYSIDKIEYVHRYAIALWELAGYYRRDGGQKVSARNCLQKRVEIYKDISKLDSWEYFNSYISALKDFVKYSSEIGDEEVLEGFLNEALAISEGIFSDEGINSFRLFDIACAVYHLSKLLIKEKKLTQVEGWLELNAELTRRLLKNHFKDTGSSMASDYWSACKDMYDFYTKTEQQEKAQQCCEELKNVSEEIKKYYSDDPLDMFTVLDDCLEIQLEQGSLSFAKNTMEECIKASDLLLQQNETEHVKKLLVHLGQFIDLCIEKREMDLAESYLLRNYKTFENLAGENPHEYLQFQLETLNILASFYHRTENKEQYLECLNQSAGIYQQLEQKNPADYREKYSNALNDLVNFYMENGQVAEAKRFQEERAKLSLNASKKESSV